jgi:hypothetical protein
MSLGASSIALGPILGGASVNIEIPLGSPDGCHQ